MPSELKDRINKRLEEKGWQLANLARESGVAKGYLSEILSGKARKPSAETLYAIATALGTTVADLLGRTTGTEEVGAHELPKSLEEFAQEARLPTQDVRMLAAIKFRNEQPKTKDDWRFLWDAIKRSVRS